MLTSSGTSAQARRTGGRRSTNRKGARAKPTTSGKYDAKAVRAWAQSNNIDVPGSRPHPCCSGGKVQNRQLVTDRRFAPLGR